MGRKQFSSLRAFLKQTGTTQAEFGARLGISQSKVSKLLNGRLRPSLALALQIAALADIPVSSLLVPKDRVA